MKRREFLKAAAVSTLLPSIPLECTSKCDEQGSMGTEDWNGVYFNPINSVHTYTKLADIPENYWSDGQVYVLQMYWDRGKEILAVSYLAKKWARLQWATDCPTVDMYMMEDRQMIFKANDDALLEVDFYLPHWNSWEDEDYIYSRCDRNPYVLDPDGRENHGLYGLSMCNGARSDVPGLFIPHECYCKPTREPFVSTLPDGNYYCGAIFEDDPREGFNLVT